MYEQYIKHIKDHLMISYDKDIIIDPNAANISFMESIQPLTKLQLFYNKNPQHENIMPLDFFKINFEQYDKTFLSGLWYDTIHIISQPPPEQAEQFIEAVCKFAESVSVIIPQSAQYAFPNNYRRLFTTDLHINKNININLVFQIWLKADY